MTNQSQSIKSFRDLIAWQKGMDLLCTTYRFTESLPKEERYGLCAQMRRAALSIPSNVAEGWDRYTGDYIRYLHVARGSSHELSPQAEACSRLGFAGQWGTLVEYAEEAARILNGLVAGVERSAAQRSLK